jgi:hypothetical protein
MVANLDAAFRGQARPLRLDLGRVAQSVDQEVDALGGQGARQGLADAAGRAGDDGCLAGKTV